MEELRIGDVVETVEHTERNIDGKMVPVTITRRVGLDKYIGVDGEEILADEATFLDWGPKLGVTRVYTQHPEHPPTEEERAEGRRRIQEVVTRAMIEQGIW